MCACVCVPFTTVSVHSITPRMTWACKSVYTGVCLCVVCSVMCQENRSFSVRKVRTPPSLCLPLNIPLIPLSEQDGLTMIRRLSNLLFFQQKPFTHMYVWTHVMCAS